MLETKSGAALNIPIGVGRTTAGTRIDICLGGLVAAGLKPSSVYFQTSRTFRNPADTATYPIVAEVTPAAAKSYDLVADDPVPQQLFVQSDRSKTGQITVTGALRGGGFPRPRMRVNVYGGAGTDASKWHLIGSAVTRADGSYRLIRRAPTVKYLYAFVDSYSRQSLHRPGKASRWLHQPFDLRYLHRRGSRLAWTRSDDRPRRRPCRRRASDTGSRTARRS